MRVAAESPAHCAPAGASQPERATSAVAGSDTVRAVLGEAERRLAGAGIDTARLDAEVLLAHALGVSRTRLAAERRDVVDGTALHRFTALLERRLRREPVAYLVGEREFWSLSLAVDARVLVPRPETEQVVAVALERLRERLAAEQREPRPGARAGRVLHVVDVGTGSGAIALALAHELGATGPHGTALAGAAGRPGPHARVAVVLVALDVSADALAVARENARRHVGEAIPAVPLLRADLLSCLAPGSVDLVVANLPYLSVEELRHAPAELGFEPEVALVSGGEDGLGVMRRLLEQARRVLRPGGSVVSEIGAAQGEAALRAAREAGLEGGALVADLEGRERVLVAVGPACTLEAEHALGGG